MPYSGVPGRSKCSLHLYEGNFKRLRHVFLKTCRSIIPIYKLRSQTIVFLSVARNPVEAKDRIGVGRIHVGSEAGQDGKMAILSWLSSGSPDSASTIEIPIPHV